MTAPSASTAIWASGSPARRPRRKSPGTTSPWGAQRRKEGFALSEVIQALFLIRRTLWRKIMDEGLLDTTYDLYQAIELNDRVTLFFDRAIFFTAVGYERGT